jgi:hypothetical protein
MAMACRPDVQLAYVSEPGEIVKIGFSERRAISGV